MKQQILVVEDEQEIQTIIQTYLAAHGYDVIQAKDGFVALEHFAQTPVHLVILDVMMPGIDGFEVLARLRQVSNVPIIMLTARVEEVDRLKGFDQGVDDYISKPFSPRELVKRVEAILKRAYPTTNAQQLKAQDLVLYVDAMRLEQNGVEIPISSSEFAILKTLMSHLNQVLSREQLIEHSFGTTFEGFDRAIDTHIKRIRQKLNDDPKQPRYLKTKYGAGYVMEG